MGVTNFDIVQANSFIGGNTMLTQGRCWFVQPYTGVNGAGRGTSPKTPLKTLAAALALAQAGRNDIVYLMAQSDTASQTTDYQSTVLNWNKDMVHLIGVNAGSMVSQRSRISNLSTATAIAKLFTLSANGCLIANIEFYHGAGSNNPTAASTCVTVSGQRNRFFNCQISGIGDSTLDDAGSNSLTVTGGENIFQHCYIGLDTVIRATAAAEVIISGTPARVIFEDCHFESYTSLTTFKAVTVATGVDRFVKFQNCDFVAVQNITSSAIPTGAIGITTMNGAVIVRNPLLVGYALLSTGGNAYVKTLGAAAATTGQGLAQSAGAT